MKNCKSIYLAGIVSFAAAGAWADPPPAAPTDAAPPPPAVQTPHKAALPFGASEVVKMYQGGINKEVLIGFVDSSTLPFHLTADNIIYLQHLGLPQEVLAAMMRRDGELQKAGAMAYQPPMAQPGPGAPMAPDQSAGPPPNTVTMPSTPPPSVNPYPVTAAAPAPPSTVVVEPDYSVYPYYGYPYPYYGGVVVGGWWGPGWHGGWGPGWHGGWHGGFGGHGGWHR